MSKTHAEAALDNFIAAVVEIRATLAAIGAAADDHFDVAPENVTWANVGDVRRTRDSLMEVLAVIRGENS